MSEKIRLCLRLKSGKEFRFFCDKYTITKSNVTGELLEFTYEKGFGECPSYFRLNDVESISRINMEEPKTWDWTHLHGSIGSCRTISCPFCGATFNGVAKWKYNYCPNCGADMRGEEE